MSARTTAVRFNVVTLEDRGVESTGMSPGLVGRLRAGTTYCPRLQLRADAGRAVALIQGSLSRQLETLKWSLRL